MAKYLLVYHGGGKMPENQAEIDAEMAAWGNWLEGLGSAVVDPGNPVGQSLTINSDGSVEPNGGSNPVSGYGIIEAADDNDATEKAKGCPHLNSGGTIEITPIVEL